MRAAFVLLLAAVVLAQAQLHYEQAAYSDNDAVAVAAADQGQMQMPPQEQEQEQAQAQDMETDEDQGQDQEEDQDQESESEEGSFAEVAAAGSDDRKKHPQGSLSRAAHKVGNAITALKNAVIGRRSGGSGGERRPSSGRLTPIRRKEEKRASHHNKPRPHPRKRDHKRKSFSGRKRDHKRRHNKARRGGRRHHGRRRHHARRHRGGRRGGRRHHARGGRRGGRGGRRSDGKPGRGGRGGMFGSGSGRGGRGGRGNGSGSGRGGRGGAFGGSSMSSAFPRPSSAGFPSRRPSGKPSGARRPTFSQSARTPDNELWHSERWVAKDDPNRDPEMAKLNLALEAVKEDILSTNKQINDERRWVIAVSKIISSYNSKMQRVEAHIIALRKEMKQLYKKKKQIENLKLQKALEAKLKEARDELKTLTTSLKHVAAKQGELNKSGKDLRQTIAGIQAQLAKLRGQQLLKKKCKRGFKLSKKLKKCVPSCKKGKRFSTQLKKCIPKCKKSHRYSKSAKKCVSRKGKKAKRHSKKF